MSIPSENVMYRTALMVGLLASASGDISLAQVKIEQDHTKPLFLEVKHETEQDMNVKGVRQQQQTTIRFVFSLKPLKTSRDVVTYRVEVLDCTDSTVKNGVAEKDTFKGMKGQRFQLDLAAGNRNAVVSETKDLVASFVGEEYKNGTPAEKKFLSDLVELVLRVHLADAFPTLPGRTVASRDVWKDSREISLQSMLRMTMQRSYSLKPGPNDNSSFA